MWFLARPDPSGRLIGHGVSASQVRRRLPVGSRQRQAVRPRGLLRRLLRLLHRHSRQKRNRGCQRADGFRTEPSSSQQSRFDKRIDQPDIEDRRDDGRHDTDFEVPRRGACSCPYGPCPARVAAGIGHGAHWPYRGLPDVRARFFVTGEDALIATEKVESVAATLHDLHLNARQHGALSHESGHVFIDLRRFSEEGELDLSWKEEGRPIVSETQRLGLGTRMIGVFSGRLPSNLDFRPDGFLCVLAELAPALVNAIPQRWLRVQSQAFACLSHGTVTRSRRIGLPTRPCCPFSSAGRCGSRCWDRSIVC